jgi:hypothetical protein
MITNAEFSVVCGKKVSISFKLLLKHVPRGTEERIRTGESKS